MPLGTLAVADKSLSVLLLGDLSLDMTGEFRIAAPRDVVWEALNNTEILKQSVPGCTEMAKTSDTTFEAKVTAKVGPVKANFSGGVTLSEIDPPNGYTINGEGKGGAAGFAKGGATVILEPDGDETILKYSVNAMVGGKLAQIGSRLIDATAKKMAEDFFSQFAEIIASSTEPVESSNVPQHMLVKPAGIHPFIWISGIVVGIFILLTLFSLLPST